MKQKTLEKRIGNVKHGMLNIEINGTCDLGESAEVEIKDVYGISTYLCTNKRKFWDNLHCSEDFPYGNYEVTAKCDGYIPVTKMITVNSPSNKLFFLFKKKVKR